MKNCNSSCLKNCYQDKQLLFLVVGFILGILSYVVIEKLLEQNKKDKNNKK